MIARQSTKGLIVAAGLGLRLRPYTDQGPKALLEVGGVPLIRRSIDILNSHGIGDVTVVVGYRHELIRELLGERVSYAMSPEFATTNNMVSLALARRAMDGHRFLYLHCDLWYDPAIVGRALAHPGDICFLVEKKQCGDEEMKVKVENGLVLEADKRLEPAETYGEWLGIIKFEPEGASAYFDAIERALSESKTMYDCAVVRQMAANGSRIERVDIGELPWVEIDFLDDLNLAKSLAAQEL